MITGPRVKVWRVGTSAYPWCAFCTVCEDARTHVGVFGGLGVNSTIGNRTHARAMEAAWAHLSWHHAEATAAAPAPTVEA